MKTTDSKLCQYENEVNVLRSQGQSYRAIADSLERRYGLAVSHNAVYSFLKTREKRRGSTGLFYDGLPEDIKEALLKQLTLIWTHDSTAIEGNTLTLGETARVLELGLTIGGKPLKDHEEVYGHAKAIDLIMQLLENDTLEAEDLFNLHRCVMQKSPIDCQRPVGDWKRDYNGTTGILDGKPVYMEYASPDDTPKLMKRWLAECERKLSSASTPRRSVNGYAWIHMALVRIHPFFVGNGRVARLIANLPLLQGGFPPLLISVEKRIPYLDALWNYQTAVGVIKGSDRLLPPHPTLDTFKKLLRDEWEQSFEIVETARQQAATRKSSEEA